MQPGSKSKVIRRYVLRGHYAGMTIKLSDFCFVSGVLSALLTEKEHDQLTRVVSQWGAFPEVTTDAHKRDVMPEVRSTVVGKVGQQGDQSPEDEASDGEDDADPEGSEARGRLDPTGKDKGLRGDLQADPKASAIARAVGKLDPTADGDWTAAGKPSLDAVERLAGFAGVTRAMVDSVAPGIRRPQVA